MTTALLVNSGGVVHAAIPIGLFEADFMIVKPKNEVFYEVSMDCIDWLDAIKRMLRSHRIFGCKQ